MGFVLFAIGGAAVGFAIAILWLGIDMVLGTHTITSVRGAGIMLICAVLGPAAFGALIAFEEMRS